MSLILKLKNVLIYNDKPEIFVCQDNIDTNYLCLTVDEEDLVFQHLAVPISKKRLFNFINGKVDLKEVFQEPEISRWLYFGDLSDEISPSTIEKNQIPDTYFPDEGFFLDGQLDEEELIFNEVNSVNNAVIHFTLSDEKGGYSIGAEELSDSVKFYQQVIEKTYIKAVKSRDFKNKDFYLEPENYKLRAFAYSPSSFNLHLYSNSQTNLFGDPFIEIALKKFDEIINQASSNNDYLELLRTFKGHTISSLKKLVNKVKDNNIVITNKWLTPNSKKPQKSYLNPEKAEEIYSILTSSEELTEEIKTITGYFTEVDVNKGKWRMYDVEEEQEFNGEASGQTLQGVTIKTVIYQVICQEIIEEFKVTEKQKAHYILNEIKELK